MTKKVNPSPRSTGGEGVSFEQRYGAYVLAHILGKAPLRELGGGRPTGLIFQANGPVDDFHIEGIDKDLPRCAAVAARIHPKLVKSNDKSTDLFTNFLRDYNKHSLGIASSERRLVLVSEDAASHPRELYELARIAREHRSDTEFRTAMDIRSKPLQDRLEQFISILESAAKNLNVPPPEVRGFLSAIVVEQHQFDDHSRSVLRAQDLINRFLKKQGFSTSLLRFDDLVTVSANAARSAGTISFESLVETLVREGKLSPSTVPLSVANIPPNKNRQVLYSVATALASPHLKITDVNLRENMRSEGGLQALLKDVSIDSSNLERNKRILSIHSPDPALLNLVEPLIRHSQSSQQNISKIIDEWSQQYKDKSMRLGYDDTMRNRADTIERCIGEAQKSLSEMQKTAVCIRDWIETNYLADTDNP